MRALLVLALLTVAAPAAAKRVNDQGSAYEPPCDEVPGTYPRYGSTDVPRNAHAWVFGGMAGDYRLTSNHGEQSLTGKIHDPFRIVELPLGHLEPSTSYTLTYAGRTLTTFATGTSDDTTPAPPPPLSSTVRTDGMVGLGIVPTGEMVLMQLTVQTARGSRTMIASPSSLQQFGAKCADVPRTLGDRVCFELSELDLAGNRSTAVRQCTTVVAPPPGRGYGHYHHGSEPPVWPGIVFLLGASLLGAITAALVMGHNAWRACSRPPATQVHVELVRRLATTLQTRAEWRLAVSGAVLVSLDCVPEVTARATLATVPIVVAVLAIATAQRMHRLLRSLDEPGATACYDGVRYAFTQTKQWMIVYPNRLERVTKAAVPTAKIR